MVILENDVISWTGWFIGLWDRIVFLFVSPLKKQVFERSLNSFSQSRCITPGVERTQVELYLFREHWSMFIKQFTIQSWCPRPDRWAQLPPAGLNSPSVAPLLQGWLQKNKQIHTGRLLFSKEIKGWNYRMRLWDKGSQEAHHLVQESSLGPSPFFLQPTTVQGGKTTFFQDC